MSEPTFPSRLKLYQHHLPQMLPGEYAITIAGSIQHEKISMDKPASISRRFAVLGERFTLADQEVRAVFPAAGSTGEYASVLPHLVLRRNTLPWERNAETTVSDSFPWLALLLFDEDEVPEKKIITVADLYATAGDSTGYFPTLFPREVGESNEEQLSVIDVPEPILRKILPSPESLLLLAHTRQGLNDQDELVGEENAVLFCNRLPEQGKRSTVHLVSLEGRYTESGFDFSSSSSHYRIVSLRSWEFYSLEHFKITTRTLSTLAELPQPPDTAVLEKISTLLDREFAGAETSFLQAIKEIVGEAQLTDPVSAALLDSSKFDKTFDGLLKNLDPNNLTLRIPPTEENAPAEAFLAQGLVPLAHQFRTGDRSVSWFRGPFQPLRPDAAFPTLDIQGLYPESADELTRFDENNGLFNVTYSAAWEIGRLLALASKDFSVSLYQWKRLVAQHDYQISQKNEHDYLPVFAHGHNHEQEASLWDGHLQPFFDKLIRFESIPGNYLLPDERLLGQESIRFFRTDPQWIIAALSGAFSIGGQWESRQQQGEPAFESLLASAGRYSMGFLLRSDVINGWPGLHIDGVDSLGNILTPLRRQLSRDILLCLFDSELRQIVFHQKPELMHFGLIKNNADFFKRRRDEEGDEVGDPLPVVDWQSKAGRVLDITKLAAMLNVSGEPAQFAMSMIAGSPRVLFDIA